MVSLNNSQNKQEKYEILRNEIIRIVDSSNFSKISGKLKSKIVINKTKYQIKDILQCLTKFLDNKDNVKLIERYYCLKNRIYKIPQCNICSNYAIFDGLANGYKNYCSLTCFNKTEEKKQKDKKSNLEKYGIENVFQSNKIKEKIRQTNLKRYGVKHNSYRSETIQKRKQTRKINDPNNLKMVKKLKSTLINRYGCVRPSKAIEKQKLTNLKKYGVESVFQSDKIKEKSRQTHLEKYNVEHNSQLGNNKKTLQLQGKQIILERTKDYFELLSEEYNGVKGNYYLWKCKICKTNFYDTIQNGKFPRCPTCNPNNKSIAENQIFKFLTNYTRVINTNSKSIIPPYELDIYLPEHNLAIEFNGLYWHSEANGKDKYYHLNKTRKCNQNNIQLIHIFEDEWNYKQQIIKSIILEKLNRLPWTIYNNSYNFEKIDLETAKKFLDYHSLYSPLSFYYNFGIFFSNYLVGVISIDHFLKIRRLCNYTGVKIEGLINNTIRFLKNYFNNKDIVFQVDLRFNRSINFPYKFEEPSFYYVTTPYFERFNRIPNNNKHYKIWNCGYLSYKF